MPRTLLPDGRIVDEPEDDARPIGPISGEPVGTIPELLRTFGRGLRESWPETAGGLAGMAIGGRAGMPVKGAMFGAGLVRALRGVARGEEPGEIALGTSGQAALEGLMPGMGRVARGMGRTLMRRAVPGTEAIKAELGGSVARGKELLLDLLERVPGLRLRTVAKGLERELGVPHGTAAPYAKGAIEEQIDRTLTEASGRGVRVDPATIMAEAREGLLGPTGSLSRSFRDPAELRGAERVLEGVGQRFSKARRMTDTELGERMRQLAERPVPGKTGYPSGIIREPTLVSPSELRTLYRNTPYVSDVPASLPGSREAQRAVRIAASHALKEAVPEVAPLLEREARLIPAHRAVDLALGREGAEAMTPRMYLGGATPRTFTVLSPPRVSEFLPGKLLTRGGSWLQRQPWLAGLLRAVGVGSLSDEDTRP